MYSLQRKEGQNMFLKSIMKLKITIMKKNLLFLLLTSSLSYGQAAGSGATDIDGNNYNTIIIGTQEWMKENLNVSKYSDGTIIPQVTSQSAWDSLTTGAWCYYNNSSSNGAKYGKLYNWYAYMGIYDTASLNNPSLRKNLAPNGWHVSTMSDWDILVSSQGGWAGSGIATGDKLKEAGSQNWISTSSAPNNGNNSSNFTARGAGYRDNVFSDIGLSTYFWTEQLNTAAGDYKTPVLYSDGPWIQKTHWGKILGLSVRCVKNSALQVNSFGYNLLNIYPNPAKDKFTIDFGNETITNYTIKINNLLGQEVFSSSVDKPQFEISKTWQGEGLYFVKIYDDNHNLLITKKIILQ
jgi:uncharacterized protein (TIGR02145 family)